MINIACPLLVEWQIKPQTMENLDKTGALFRHYLYALYATDVKFQQANQPLGSQDEAKEYFSQKHRPYGYKTEFSVSPSGLCVNVTSHAPGSHSDLTIFRKNMRAHKQMLQKSPGEQLAPDNGELWE